VEARNAFAASTLLPADRDYYRFSGFADQLTLFGRRPLGGAQAPETASAGQIEKLHDAIGHDNSRPVQPVAREPC
jgi:carbonic anhydrase